MEPLNKHKLTAKADDTLETVNSKKRRKGMKKIKLFIIAAFIIATAAVLGGCSSDNGDDTLLMAGSLCLGNRANCLGINYSSEDIRKFVNDITTSYGYISVIGIDGEPDVWYELSYEIDSQYANANPKKLKADAQNKAEMLLASLPEIIADSPEADILEALRLSVRTLSGIGSEYTKVIYVVDSGISTSGLLNFNNNIINAEPEAVAEALYSMDAIPDFSGITVIWQQMGDVSAPQDALSPAQVKKLKEIWRAIISRTGGTLELSDNLGSPVDDTVEYPAVSVVAFPEETPVAFSAEEIIYLEEPQFISEEQCRFVGDSDEYVDPTAAESTLQPIADYMLSNPDFKILLIGCTAGDEDNDFSRDLSERRANAVKNTLIQQGVSENRIYTLGMGSSDPWHIYGVGTDGELASQNRKVVILSADSPMASSLGCY